MKKMVKISTFGMMLFFLCIYLMATPVFCTNSTIDQFDSPTLAPEWSWINEDPNYWNLTEAPGKLRLTTLTGEFCCGFTNYQNLLVRDAPSGDFEVIMYISNISNPYSSNPSFHGFHIGLLIWQDHDNAVQLDLRDSDVLSLFRVEKGGSDDFVLTSDFPNISYGYLKIKKIGDSYQGSFSSDGITWTTHTTVGSISLNSPKIAIWASNGIGVPASGHTDIKVDIEYIKISPMSDNTLFIIILVIAVIGTVGVVVLVIVKRRSRLE